jgi:fructose-1,6-bisphosphatase/inositol monophosphatase family enzyme
MNVPKFDPARVAQLIRDVAAAEITPRFKTLASHEIREKKPGDLVTIADESAERALIPGLEALLPGSKAIGEESIAADPALLNHLKHAEQPIWVIDPVDGTINFAHGRPLFAVLVGLVVNGQPIAGWIHDPLTGTMAMAEKGAGAWNGNQRLHVAQPDTPERMRGQLMARPFSAEGQAALRARGIVFHRDPEGLRCAGQEHLRLVKGEWHFNAYARMRPWDHCAGVVIHGEAGGFSGYLKDRASYHVSREEDLFMLAPSPESWEALREDLQHHFKAEASL